MGTQDRRNSMGLEEAYRYWRGVENLEMPSLYKTASAIRTVEMAITPAFSEWHPEALTISSTAWTVILENLLHVMLTRFPGYFLIYGHDSDAPLAAGLKFPAQGYLEFYPEAFKRRTDCFKIQLDRIKPATLVVIRYQFANGEQNLLPDMFTDGEPQEDNDAEPSISTAISQFYEICEKEAVKGMKKAQRTWYHTLCEARACKSKEQRRELLRRLSYLEVVWGCGSVGSA